MTLDIDRIRSKYAEERDKRVRTDGNEQYVEIAGKFAHYKEDPYIPVKPRAPVTDHVTFAFIGGGYAGLVTAAKLKEAGIEDVRIVEKGGDFGGTWYWNRYPGAQCDTASLIYMPLLEETGHMPSERYAHAPEILSHCQRIGNTYGLYDNALLHTEVTGLEWDDANARWVIRTNRGDAFTAQFVGLGTGPLHVAKLPGIPGIEKFQGHSFHTSRWDYAYTGGSPEGAPMTKLADKRVAIIGTGATSVQVVPHLSRDAKELFVFQRTPSSVDARNNGPIDADWFDQISEPGWQYKWLENFAAHFSGIGIPEVDLVADGWTDMSRRMRAKMVDLPPEAMNPAGILAAYEATDHEKMAEIRARAEAIVNDRETAENLKAWYRQLCKRPCFHDEYLQSFNKPNTHLIDTDGKGVERITEKGLVVGGKEYEVDCIIYASGFEVGTSYQRRSGFDAVGKDGMKLSDYWADGMRSLHGIHVHGFPNMYIVHPAQGANLISNVPHNLVDSAKTISTIVSHTLQSGQRTNEVTKQAEDDWLALLSTGMGMIIGGTECTPGYYNNEGHGWEGTPAALGTGYPAGAVAYFNYIDEWRNSGRFEGLAFA
ncbi:MAG: NAD(P)/FAD-dependent oxidoreductase [Sphingomonadales bacterium]|jgi:cation diffusion facilitator CzcD-associated flavoprotein CzcO|nr:NAD(P)/FAD-dependent oxidoreductase [Sphingomonadales bacterium]MBK9004170.1 NAD(P)/FAD-dependent oxidoreductase [Sphingomonadales bacterium]MBK9269347.1 NAD(P)/FAD-dependent oxidoreductase [Sphingomonadales bacterium]MBP6434108.1 NAD(P)/FAD-dependent oxidoreductase [Sphingorhabdus sp.]